MNQELQYKKQLGWCDTCGAAAYAIRHTAMPEYEFDDDGHLVYMKTIQVEHFMCPRHKQSYFAYMEAEKKKLEKKAEAE
jgi:hypothetical protein